MTPEEALERRRKADHLRTLREHAELVAVLQTQPGRAVLWRLLERCGNTRSSFAGEETHLTAFREGKRDIGLRLLGDCLTVEPSLYTTMQQEALARAEEDALAVSRETAEQEDYHSE